MDGIIAMIGIEGRGQEKKVQKWRTEKSCFCFFRRKLGEGRTAAVRPRGLLLSQVVARLLQMQRTTWMRRRRRKQRVSFFLFWEAMVEADI
jgi:hypothetical protein